MGWADDMYAAGYTSEHGGLMDRSGYRDYSNESSAREKSSGSTAPNKGNHWTDSDREKVVDLYHEGSRIESIAEKFGRTPYAIAWQLYNLNKISEKRREKYK